MKITIETLTGVSNGYTFDVSPQTTIRQLKQLYLQASKDTENLERKILAVGKTPLLDNEKTLEDYNVTNDCDLALVELDMQGGRGFNFANLSKEEALKVQDWSSSAPSWRVAKPGLCLEGFCRKTGCAAANKQVVIPVGFGDFDVGDNVHEQSLCPKCGDYVDPITCGFNNCWWKFEGKKKNPAESGRPPSKCSSEWAFADNKYHYFDQNISGFVEWTKLVIYTRKTKPHS